MGELDLCLRFELRCMHQLKQLKQPEPLHGHNFYLEVTLRNSLSTTIGWVFSRDKFKKIINEAVVQIYDKALLNDHLEHATGEELITDIKRRLQSTELSPLLTKIALQETTNNRFELEVS